VSLLVPRTWHSAAPRHRVTRKNTGEDGYSQIQRIEHGISPGGIPSILLKNLWFNPNGRYGHQSVHSCACAQPQNGTRLLMGVERAARTPYLWLGCELDLAARSDSGGHFRENQSLRILISLLEIVRRSPSCASK